MIPITTRSSRRVKARTDFETRREFMVGGDVGTKPLYCKFRGRPYNSVTLLRRRTRIGVEIDQVADEKLHSSAGAVGRLGGSVVRIRDHHQLEILIRFFECVHDLHRGGGI